MTSRTCATWLTATSWNTRRTSARSSAVDTPCVVAPVATSVRGSIARSNAVVTESECGRRAGRPAALGAASVGAGGVGAAAAGVGGGLLGGCGRCAARAGAAAAGGAGAGVVVGATPGSGALAGAAGCLAPRGGAAAAGGGAGGGVTTIVGSRSRSLPAAVVSVVRGGCSGDVWVRGTLGNAPARDGVRGSGGDDESSDDDENAGEALDRRESRVGPGQSHIERGASAGAAV